MEQKRQTSSSPLLRVLTLTLQAALLIPVICCTTLLPTVQADASSNSIPRSTHNGHYQRLREAATADASAAASNSRNNRDKSAESQQLPALLQERPPWNPSPQIDDTGFVSGAFSRVPGEWESEVQLGGSHQDPLHLEMVQAHIRQVPGDGNCLFHSISTCMAYANNNHTQMEYPHHLGWLYKHSAQLRQQAVDCLRHQRKILFLQGHEYLRAHDLVEAAAAQYGISATEYCDFMQQDSYWGGGPEIVALCNVLKRPIHVYELASGTTSLPSGGGGGGHSDHANGGRAGSSHNNQNNNHHHLSNTNNKEKNVFVLRRMACFGSPRFDKKEPFHILSADSRFPDISPGKQLSSGNHFLAVFPLERQKSSLQKWIRAEQRRKRLLARKQRRHQKDNLKKKKQGVRGGGGGSDSSFASSSFLEDDDRRRNNANMKVKNDDEHAYFPWDEYQILEPPQRMVLERARMRQQQQRAAAAAAAAESPVKSYLSGLWKRFLGSEDGGGNNDDNVEHCD